MKFCRFETLGTLEILILCQERNGIADERMGQLLQSIFRFARFRPVAAHPHYAWWQRCWGGEWVGKERFYEKMMYGV